MSLGLLGKKLGMTRLFDEKSQAMIPVTVIEVSGNTCLQVKTVEKDGYSAVQVGYDDKKEFRTDNPSLGHFKKHGSTPKYKVQEFRFPAGVAELDTPARARLAAVTADLQRRIGALPRGSAWRVGVEGAIERAADGRGLLVADWELALLRVGVTAQYLVGRGIPAERLSVRFHAGAMASGSVPAQGVTLSLLCCVAASQDG